MQVQVQTAFANTIAGEFAGIGRERSQLNLAEAGRDIQALQRVEGRQAALDGDRRIAVDLAGDIDRRGGLLLIVERADVAVEILNGGGERRAQAEIGKVGRAIGQPDAANMQRQRGAGRAGRRGSGWLSRLVDQQLVDVRAQVRVNDEARIWLIDIDRFDGQSLGLVLIVDAFEPQSLPFDEVAVLQRVERMQLGDLGRTGCRKSKRFGSIQRQLQVAREHAAAQFESNEGCEIGLRHAQIEIPGANVEPTAQRSQLQLASSLQVALATDSGIQIDLERRFCLAVELSKGELQGREFEGNLLLGHAVSQMDAIVGQLRLAQLNPPGGLGRLRGRCLAVRGCRLGEQPLPVQCTVLLAYDPGFQPGAAHFADLQALIGQVELCFRDFEALQTHEWIALQVIDRQRRERGVQVEQAQLEGLAEIQFVARAGAERAALESPASRCARRLGQRPPAWRRRPHPPG